MGGRAAARQAARNRRGDGTATPPEDERPGGSRTRLTSAGTGVLLLLLSLGAGIADARMGDDYGTVFGVGFVLSCLVAVVWVRRADVIAAPVCAPIAFAVALALTTPTDDKGLSQRGVTVATDLAVNADWLYAGTVLAAVVALGRFLAGRRKDGRGQESRRQDGRGRGRHGGEPQDQRGSGRRRR